MRARHRQLNRPKIVAVAATVILGAAVAIALPQAYATNTETGGEPPRAESPQAQAPQDRRASGESESAPTETLRQKAAIPGTAWTTDPDTGQVVVTADSTVGGDRWESLMSTVRSIGGNKVRVQRSEGTFRLFAEGGDAIFAGNGRCSLGFNVKQANGNPAILTAGHCVGAVRQFSLTAGGAAVATARQSRFPGNGDFALLTYNNPATQAPSTVDLGGGRTIAIRRAAEAAVNQQVFRMGSTTGLRNGRVTGLNATVNYPEGTVTGLIQTTVCAEPGDSGGPLFTRDGSAIGLTSGGSGNCQAGGVTFFQPVTRALTAVGARIGS